VHTAWVARLFSGHQFFERMCLKSDKVECDVVFFELLVEAERKEWYHLSKEQFRSCAAVPFKL